MISTTTLSYSVENIVKSFGGAKALSGVSMSVQVVRFIALPVRMDLENQP